MSLVTAVSIWLLLVWLHTFTYLTCYEQHEGIYSYLSYAVITMAATLLYWFCFKEAIELSSYSDLVDDDFDDDLENNLNSEIADEDETSDDGEQFAIVEKERSSILHNSLFTVLVLTLIFLIALTFEMWTDVSVFTDSTYITIGRLNINKKNIYNPVLVLVFPLWTQVIFRGMYEDRYKWKSIISGCIQLIALTVMSFLLFMKLPNIWLIELCFIECLTVIGGICKYTWKYVKEKGNIVALAGLYIVFWCVLLSLFHYTGQTRVQYMYGDEWSVYKENVFQILANASDFGASTTLAMNDQIKEFLTNRGNYLLSILYYNGRTAGIVVAILLVLFLISTRVLLGRVSKHNRNYLVYHAAWWSLAFHVIIGVPYSLGLIALPIALPFAGEISLYMDTIATGLLVWCAMENTSIRGYFYELCMTKELFDNDDIKGIDIVKLKADRLQMELYEREMLQIVGGESRIDCVSELFSDFNVLVVKPVNIEDNCLFILQQGEDEKWVDVKDEEIREKVGRLFMEEYKPDCMEVLEK